MKPNQSNRRSRNKGGKRSGGGGQNRSNPRNQNQIKQMLDKFNSQGRDARQAGDRVAAENFFQHAEHYQRMLNEIEGAGANKSSLSASDAGNSQNSSSEASRGNEKPVIDTPVNDVSKDATPDSEASVGDTPGNEKATAKKKPAATRKRATPKGDLFTSPLDIIESIQAGHSQAEDQDSGQDTGQDTGAKAAKPPRRAPRAKKAAAE